MFDIKDLYSSINKCLLIEALEFAKQHVTTKSKDKAMSGELRYVNLSGFLC